MQDLTIFLSIGVFLSLIYHSEITWVYLHCQYQEAGEDVASTEESQFQIEAKHGH